MTRCMSNTNGPLIRETMEEPASKGRPARDAHLTGRTGTPSGILPTCGLVVSEAMNFCLPVILPCCMGRAEDLVCHGWNGFVIPHSDTGALTQMLPAPVISEPMRLELGARSASIVSGHSIEACAEGIVEGCLAVACRKKPSRSAMCTPVGKALSGLFAR